MHVAASKLADIDGVVVCLETALPVKFAETITEAIGKFPELPERFAGLLEADTHVTERANDVAALKQLIAERSTFVD